MNTHVEELAELTMEAVKTDSLFIVECRNRITGERIPTLCTLEIDVENETTSIKPLAIIPADLDAFEIPEERTIAR